MSAEPRLNPTPVESFRPVSPSAAALGHEAANALTVAHARLQRLRRRTDRGEVDCAAFLVELDDACRSIRRAATVLDALVARAGRGAAIGVGAVAPPAPRPTDD